jgi:hypothetical protein
VADAGLRDEPIVHRPHLVLGLTPARGCLLNDPRATATSMNPVDIAGSCPVSAEVLDHAGAAQAGYNDGEGQAVHLGGYDGWLQERTEFFGGMPGASRGLSAPHTRASAIPMWVAVLRLEDGRRLVVQTPSTSPWNRTELDRFVRAIGVPSA